VVSEVDENPYESDGGFFRNYKRRSIVGKKRMDLVSRWICSPWFERFTCARGRFGDLARGSLAAAKDAPSRRP